MEMRCIAVKQYWKDQYDVQMRTANAREQRFVVDDLPRDRRSLRVVLPGLLICCGAALLLSDFDTGDLQNWLHRAGPWAPTAFIFAGITLMSVLVPKTVVSIAAGAFFGTSLGVLLMLIVAVMAAALNYAIGRWWLHDSIDQKLNTISSRDRDLWARAVRDTARDAGFGFHFLMRLTPLPTTLISYGMGASGSRLRPFLIAAAVAVIPQALWVHSGTAAALWSQPDASALQWSSVVVSVTAAIAISVVVPRVAIRRIESTRQMS
jgi:uncharacterized membrane protein YdjX (TVP38/TMEM64 family)